MLKTTIDPNGRRFKFGRNLPKAPCPKMRLSNYLLQRFPRPPLAVDYRTLAKPYLALAYGNDVAGDCTVAGMYHCAAVSLANAHRPVPFTGEHVTTLYKQLSGWNGIEDDPSDTGLDLETVLNYTQQTGLPPNADRLFAWMEIDGSRQDEVEAAIYLFNNVYMGVSLPQAWQDSMDGLVDGDTWDVAGRGDPMAGHCVMGASYDPSGLYIDTWALNIRVTWPAVKMYFGGPGGQVYTILDMDSLDIATSRSPTGLNWTQMVSDFQSFGARRHVRFG